MKRIGDIESVLSRDFRKLDAMICEQKIWTQAFTLLVLREARKSLYENNNNDFAFTLLGYAKSHECLAGHQEYDIQGAKECFEKAAMLGNPRAMYCLAHRHIAGSGVEKDLIMAAKYSQDALKILSGNSALRQVITGIMANKNCPADVLSSCKMALLNDDIEIQKPEWKPITEITMPQTEWNVILSVGERQNLLRLISPRSASGLSEIKNTDFLNELYIFYSSQADASDESDDQAFESNLHLAKKCLQLLGKSKLLHDSIALIEIRRELQNVQLDDLQNVAKLVNQLLCITNDNEVYYLLAELLMKLDTETIFINHKDKFRLIISLLSKVDDHTRVKCLDYDLILLQTLESLYSIQASFRINFTNTTKYIPFQQIVRVVYGPDYNNNVPYSPNFENSLLHIEANEQKLLEHFGTTEIESFEKQIYKSYADFFEQLNIEYLQQRLLSVFKERIVPKKTNPDELTIDHGNYGIARKRNLIETNINSARVVRLHTLAMKAIELALIEFKAPRKIVLLHNKTYRNKQIVVANKLLDKCKGQGDFKNILMEIVTFLQSNAGDFGKYSFKLPLLRYLCEALNIGNIETLDTKPEKLCNDLCDILLLQCRQTASQRLEDDKVEELNTSNATSNNNM